MTSSSFMNKQTVISGVTFATNNFVAALSHQDLPTEFHIIRDFLASSPLKFALTEPASVSFKSVMQVWNSAVFGKGLSGTLMMNFEFNGVTYNVTPTVIEEALHLPILCDSVPDVITDSTLFEFVAKLGYNGEVKSYGNLFKTKLKKEWNFFFDSISRCFLNKTSNFDDLPSGSLKFGYSLIHSTVFDYGSFILKALSDGKSDKLGYVCFLRFFQLICNHLCPGAIFEDDVILPICRITENNLKSLVNSDKANGFTGTAYIPDEVRLFLKEKMPTQYGSVSDAMGQGQSHLKSARSDVSGRQSGSKDFSSTPLTKKKKQGGVQGVLVKKADKVDEVVFVKRKLVLRDETDSEDDMPISSKLKKNKEVSDTTVEVVAPSSKPQKKRKLSKSRYHIPLKTQVTDGQDTSNPDEQSNPDAQANPDVGNPNDTPSKVVSISVSPAKASPNTRHVDISWEKLGADASNLGLTHPMEKKRKAEEKVFQRLKKLKGSSPQEPEPQSGSTTIDDPAPQEPLTQTSSEPHATQEPLVENTDASLSNPDSVAPDASGAPDAEPILIQPMSSRPMVNLISESKDKLKGVVPDDADDSGDSDDNDSDDGNDNEKDELATTLKSSLGTNFGSSSTFMTGKDATGNDLRQDFSGPSPLDPAELPRKDEWENEWYRSFNSVSFPCALEHAAHAARIIENEDLKNHLKATTLLSKSLKTEIDYVKAATEHARTDISQNLTKAPTAFQLRVVEFHVKTIVLEQSHIHNRIDSLESKVTDIQASLSLILNLLSNSDVKKGEKVSQTKCTPELVLRRNNDDDKTGNDGDDIVFQRETSDAAVMKSTIQTSQSQSMQSTHVSGSGVRTVRTLVKFQILTEEQILTGDQILMADQILTPGHGQTLSTIPEGDKDILIDNPEDAANLFRNFTTRDGNVVTLYHTDKRVQ
ncbi:hypothetical protein POM88_045443 [Heracleum sosnowskyi]|uniref:Uncharacterized protein n=1 Tax=Heracleum sosnowskyi TaxID=360622 RepID=A0AAD8H5Q4_9APIA|nr:hypothetical protein POM88_045443 [Heracleum sosnowskyi]